MRFDHPDIILTEKEIARFWKYVDKKSEDECWEWKGITNTVGYGKIFVKDRYKCASRVAWVLHNGQIPYHNSYHGYCVCHKCDNSLCVNPAHLFLGTPKDNMLDMEGKGRGIHPSGEKSGTHKLTEQQVIEIRKKYIPYKYTARMLSKEYNVHKETIVAIILKKTWKHTKETGEVYAD